MGAIRVPRPQPAEHAPYFSRYIDLVPGEDALPALATQIEETARRLAALDEGRAMRPYAEGKWSVKQVVGHLADSERVFALRALWAARGAEAPLPGYEDDRWAAAAGSDARPLAALLAEYRAVRSATLALFDGLPPDALTTRAVANAAPITARAMAWCIAGHERHHLAILRERYGVG
jgi:uncharacterized damage-inducible protein DinB